ncbi:hypothetical protein HID58_032502 [Brassica napus]|uniref:RING-type E3 ubiquitin transferase n=1 Tax=Brassica napus TaxID=3708 RepID=A0ABQ8BWI4_BRANA|nr:hypothetical protein HID58_032502 [Brassica napus]
MGFIVKASGSNDAGVAAMYHPQPVQIISNLLSIIRSISNVSFLDPQDDPPDDPQDEPSGGLSSTLVQKLPQFKTSKPARPDGSECVVCLDGFRKGRWCRRLPGCGHVFHRKCVDTWFLRADTCPTCRASVRLTE